MDGEEGHHGAGQDQAARDQQRLVQPGAERVVCGIDDLLRDLCDRGVLGVFGAARGTPARCAARLDRMLHQALEVGRDPDRLQTGGQVAGQLGVDDGAEDGHAEHGAHLAAGVGCRRCHARTLGFDHRQRDGRNRYQQHADADAGDGQDPTQCRETDRRVQHRVRDQDAPAREEAADRHGPAGTDASHQRARERRDDDQSGRHRQEVDRGLIRRCVGDHLQIQRGEEEDGERPEVRGERDEVRPGERRPAEQREIEHRRLDPMLGHHERDTGNAAQDEERNDPIRGVAGLLALDHGKGQTGQEGGPEEEPEHVDTPALAVRTLGHGDRRHHERDHAEAEVEPEDGSPAGESHQRTADHRPEGESEPRDRGPDPKRIGPRLPVRVHVADDRKGPGLAGRGADAHDDSRRDQPVDVARECSDDRSDAEDGDAGEHDPLAAEQIAQHPRRQHEAGKGQGVAVDDPLQRGDARVQVALHVGQSDADDGVVEEGEEQDGAQGGQRDDLGGRAETARLDVEALGRSVGAVARPGGST